MERAVWETVKEFGWALRERLASSYLFLPLVFAGITASGATLIVRWEVRRGVEHQALPFLAGTDAAQVRDALLAILGTEIGLLGVVLTITLVPLQMAASQLGPTLLQLFVRDRTTHLCFAVMSAGVAFTAAALVAGGPWAPGVEAPRLTLLLAMALFVATLIDVAALFHRTSIMLQPWAVVATLERALHLGQRRRSRQLAWALRRTRRRGATHRSPTEEPGKRPDAQSLSDERATVFLARRSGQLKRVDHAALVATALDRHVRIRLLKHRGDTVIAGEPLAHVSPPVDASVRRRLERELHLAAPVGRETFEVLDIEYPLISLVVMASRALSPAINDPLTAIQGIHGLGRCLAELEPLPEVPPQWTDSAGRILLIDEPPNFVSWLDLTIHPIRQLARSNAEVCMALIGALGPIGRGSASASHRKSIRWHLRLLAQDAEAHLPSEADRQRVRAALVATGLLGAPEVPGAADGPPERNE